MLSGSGGYLFNSFFRSFVIVDTGDDLDVDGLGVDILGVFGAFGVDGAFLGTDLVDFPGLGDVFAGAFVGGLDLGSDGKFLSSFAGGFRVLEDDGLLFGLEEEGLLFGLEDEDPPSVLPGLLELGFLFLPPGLFLPFFGFDFESGLLLARSCTPACSR